MWRDYDPTTGRYIESDPISISAGVDTYAYSDGNPIANTDPLGMPVEGSRITCPRLNLIGIQITNARLTLSLNAWGKLGLVNLYGNVEGYVNVDVHCKEGCRTWDIHNQINLAAYGHVTIGPSSLCNSDRIAGRILGRTRRECRD